MKEHKAFMEEFFKPDGIFDEFDEDKDERMNEVEGVKMHKVLNSRLRKKFGIWPSYTKEERKLEYTLFNSLSEKDGITIQEFHKIHFIVEAASKQLMITALNPSKPTWEQIQQFMPIVKLIRGTFASLGSDSEAYMYYKKFEENSDPEIEEAQGREF